MYRILIIVAILGGIFAYSKYSQSDTKISYPQFPQDLSTVNLSSLKDWSVGIVEKYFPDTASQTAVLGEKAKNESLILVVEAAKKLSPQDFETLQQFICAPTTN